MKPLQKIIFIVGPTAVGKSEIACSIAKKINGEIVSCDSMQIYKEISIASCKPSDKMLNSIPHHLINIVSVTQEFDVATFNRKANLVIKRIHDQNKIPVMVGGSGLYIKVLLDGIFEDGQRNLKFRESLEKKMIKEGNLKYYKELKKLDSKSAEKIHPHDRRRIIRALEVIKAKGKPMSVIQKKRKGIWGEYDISIISLNRERQEIYDRINKRVDRMFRKGAVEEVKKICKKKISRTVKFLISVREIMGYLNGEYDLQRAKYLIKLNTRHYAKRQLTWFRKDKRLKWVTIRSKDKREKIVNKILKMI